MIWSYISTYFVTSHSCFYSLHCVYNPLSTSMSYFPYNDCLHDNINRFICNYSFLSYFFKFTLSIWFRHLIYMNYPSTTCSLISLFIHRVRTVASYRPSALTPPTPPHSAPHSAPLRPTPLQALKHERILSPQGKLTQLRLARTYCTATENTREKLSDLLNKNDASYMMTDVSLNGNPWFWFVVVVKSGINGNTVNVQPDVGGTRIRVSLFVIQLFIFGNNCVYK